MSSALWPVEVALAAKIKADGPLAALLAGYMVYSRKRSDTISVAGENIDTPFPFITFGARNEAGFNQFGRLGNDGNYTLHIWSRKPDNEEISAIYKELERVCRGKLTLSSGAMVYGWARYVTDSLDADGATMHGIVEYNALTQS